MSDAPIRVDSRAQVGDPAISPIEREVLGRRWKARDKRRSFWGFTLLVALGSMLAWMPIELLIWSIAGNLPYFSAGIDSTALLVGIALGAGFAVWLFFTGHRKLLPLVPLPVIMGVGFAGGVQYIEASRTEGSVVTTAFYIRSLNLKHTGRGLHARRFQASANLIDRDGRHWTLNGRYAYIHQLAGQDCMFVAVRKAGDYRFPVGPLTLVETPYVDSVTRKRHPRRCFAAPPPESNKRS